MPTGWNATCSAGVCKFAATLVGQTSGLTGSGTLATVTFTGVNAGLTTITFSNVLLADKDGGTIANTTTTGFLTVLKTVTLNGTVTMQGRANPGDTTGTVTIYDEYGYAPPITATIGTNGAWSATVGVDAQSTTFDIWASHPLYLTNQLTGVDLSTVTTHTVAITKLLGGDANNDGKIDVSDLTCIGGDFGGNVSHCTGGSSDINADGTINILDLVLAGGNYELSSPRSW